ncbi:hypothetical protein LUW74_08875 [Actinomadura madurae]|uniref:hypothetical protein n=1 Tax=Actinomadura madurae TaxID=1993 RepID=UPI002026B473|nr:hypothetical protein [Actinomadura madurae]URN03442.1 hypothetical protein LUW74_08875 [Actinomadura madurae]
MAESWADLSDSELRDLCERLVRGLAKSDLPLLISREETLLALARRLAGEGAVMTRVQLGGVLSERMNEVTARTRRRELKQARDLLGLSAEDDGFEERLGDRDPRVMEARLYLAAKWTKESSTSVRRKLGTILGALLTATETFRRRDGDPEVARVLRMCEGFASELDQTFEAADGRATRYSTGLYVPRRLQGDLLARVTGRAWRTKIVGEAGYGKSSLLWGLHKELTGAFRPLLVNAAWLRAEPGLDPVLDGEVLVRAVEALAAAGERPVLLLDTVDLLLHEQHEIDRANAMLNAAVDAGARAVVSCREQESHALDPRFDQVRLGAYDEDELHDVIERHVEAFCPDAPPKPIGAKVALMMRMASRGLSMAEVCRHPLLLRLLFEAYEGTFPDEEVNSLDVLGAYFDNKIRRDRNWRTDPVRGRGGDMGDACACIAIGLFSSGSVESPYEELSSRARDVAAAWDGCAVTDLDAAFDVLLSRSVLLKDERGHVRFRHQLLFEYVAARALLARGRDGELRRLQGIVQDRPLDLYVGAVFEQALIYGWHAHPALRRHVSAALDALAASGQVNLQSMALVVAAHHPDVDADVPGLLARAGTEVVRRFVALTPRVTGAGVGRAMALLRLVWKRDEQACRRAVLNVLERFAGQDAAAVRDLVEDLDCVWYVIEKKGELLVSDQALPRAVGLVAAEDPGWSTTTLRSLFEAGCLAASSRALAVTILGIVGDQWEHLGSKATLDLFIEATIAAQARNGGQEATPVRLAAGRLWGLHWIGEYRLGGPEPRAAEWAGLVAEVRAELARHPQAPWPTQLRLAGLAVALAALPDGNALIDPTLSAIFPPAEESFGLPLLELPDSFLIPLLRGPSPAGHRLRGLLRDALGALPADPAHTADPRCLRATVARTAVHGAELSPDEVAELLTNLSSLQRPSQWTAAGGFIAAVVPAALGGHPVARAALDAVRADPGAIGAPGRKSVTASLSRHLSDHPDLLPVALTCCGAWLTAAPLIEAVRRDRDALGPALARHAGEVDDLIDTLFAKGGGAQQDAMNLWLAVEDLDILRVRGFAELRKMWEGAQVHTARQNVLRLMGRQAGRGRLPLDDVTSLIRTLVSVRPDGLHAVGTAYRDEGTLNAARDALVIALSQAGPLTEEALDDLLMLALGGSAGRGTQVWLRFPLRRLGSSGRSGDAFAFYARLGRLTADRGPQHQNKLANKLFKEVATLCGDAPQAERLRWIESLPSLPVPFAQVMVRALARTAFDKVHGPLLESAADEHLPEPVKLTIRSVVQDGARLSGSIVIDELLAPPGSS